MLNTTRLAYQLFNTETEIKMEHIFVEIFKVIF